MNTAAAPGCSFWPQKLLSVQYKHLLWLHFHIAMWVAHHWHLHCDMNNDRSSQMTPLRRAMQVLYDHGCQTGGFSRGEMEPQNSLSAHKCILYYPLDCIFVWVALRASGNWCAVQSHTKGSVKFPQPGNTACDPVRVLSDWRILTDNLCGIWPHNLD